jgi:hypothetical protein
MTDLEARKQQRFLFKYDSPLVSTAVLSRNSKPSFRGACCIIAMTMEAERISETSVYLNETI